MYESGNDVKAILGTTNLCWNPNVQEGFIVNIIYNVP